MVEPAESITVQTPRPMETFGQSYGYILSRTKIKERVAGELEIPELRSYARVYVNGNQPARWTAG